MVVVQKALEIQILSSFPFLSCNPPVSFGSVLFSVKATFLAAGSSSVLSSSPSILYFEK